MDITFHVFALISASILLYLASLLFAWSMQERMIFLNSQQKAADPRDFGLPELISEPIETPTGERVQTWVPRALSTDQPALLYFHGNKDSLSWRSDRFRKIIDAGFALHAVTYRGYGGSTGKPSQEALFSDALQAFDIWQGRTNGPLVLYGESLGTAVATYVASQRPAAALVLEAPFTSMTDMARRYFPYLPVARFIRHPFNSLSRIGDINMPVLFLHGDRDLVVPLSKGRSLFTSANEPKRFHEFSGGTHIDLWDRGSFSVVQTFLSEYDITPAPFSIGSKNMVNAAEAT